MTLVPHQAMLAPAGEASESFILGVVVAPDDVPADHAGLPLWRDQRVHAPVQQGLHDLLDGRSSWPISAGLRATRTSPRENTPVGWQVMGNTTRSLTA
jgi:hypothetical protein